MMPASATWLRTCGDRGKGKTIDRCHLHLDIGRMGRGKMWPPHFHTPICRPRATGSWDRMQLR